MIPPELRQPLEDFPQAELNKVDAVADASVCDFSVVCDLGSGP